MNFEADHGSNRDFLRITSDSAVMEADIYETFVTNGVIREKYCLETLQRIKDDEPLVYLYLVRWKGQIPNSDDDAFLDSIARGYNICVGQDRPSIVKPESILEANQNILANVNQNPRNLDLLWLYEKIESACAPYSNWINNEIDKVPEDRQKMAFAAGASLIAQPFLISDQVMS